jgi:hypothetical protein
MAIDCQFTRLALKNQDFLTTFTFAAIAFAAWTVFFQTVYTITLVTFTTGAFTIIHSYKI